MCIRDRGQKVQIALVEPGLPLVIHVGHQEMCIRDRRDAVEAEIRHMQRTLDMIRYKCWYYENAMADGNEERVKTLTPAEMPQEIREAYEGAHRL